MSNIPNSAESITQRELQSDGETSPRGMIGQLALNEIQKSNVCFVYLYATTRLRPGR